MANTTMTRKTLFQRSCELFSPSCPSGVGASYGSDALCSAMRSLSLLLNLPNAMPKAAAPRLKTSAMPIRTKTSREGSSTDVKSHASPITHATKSMTKANSILPAFSVNAPQPTRALENSPPTTSLMTIVAIEAQNQPTTTPLPTTPETNRGT